MGFIRRTCTFGPIFALLTAGCGNTPDVSINYYLPQSELRLTIIRTVTCDEVNNPIVANTVISTPVHRADSDQLVAIKIAELDGSFSNSDLTFEFYQDGRLKSINTESNGRGSQILESAISLARSAVNIAISKPFAAAPGFPDREKGDESRSESVNECEYIRRSGSPNNSTDTLTVKYKTVIVAKNCNTDSGTGVAPTILSQGPVKNLQEILGEVTISVHCRASGVSVTSNGYNSDNVMLTMRKPLDVGVKVTMGTGSPNIDFWSGNFTLAFSGPSSEYKIPVPRAALFGKQIFRLIVQESGAVTTIGYTKETGAPQAIGVGKSVLETLDPSAGSAARLSALKMEADIIAAQQRVVKCRADPANCK